jgi:hypothetical protein
MFGEAVAIARLAVAENASSDTDWTRFGTEITWDACGAGVTIDGTNFANFTIAADTADYPGDQAVTCTNGNCSLP